MRLMSAPVVFALGPEANHYVTGPRADELPLARRRHGRPDPAARRRPPDDRRRLPPARAPDHAAGLPPRADRRARGDDGEEAERAVDALARGRDRLDLYGWTRALALRVAMRALFGFDPTRSARRDGREEFERALGFWGAGLRGPDAAWPGHARTGRCCGARAGSTRVIFGEIARRGEARRARRGHPQPPARRDRRGRRGAVGPGAARPGHDAALRRATTRRPPRSPSSSTSWHATRERGGLRAPAARRRAAGRRPDHELDLAIDETLRMYPPAWIGPRRSIDAFELHGAQVPGGVLVNYCSWASHHLASVFPEPPVPPRALRPGRACRACEGRLRAVRRRFAHLYRDALRAARGADDCRDDAGSASGSRSPRRSARCRSARCRPCRRAAGCRSSSNRPENLRMCDRSGVSSKYPRQRPKDITT